MPITLRRQPGVTGCGARSCLPSPLLAGLVLVLPLVSSISAQESAGSTRVPDPGQLPLRPTRVVQFRVTEGTWMSVDVAPDGQAIVFDLLGNLYTIPIAGGQATQLTSGVALNRQPRFSPDGRHLVFVSDRGGSENVWIADRNGTQARQLSDLDGYDGFGGVTSPTWSPDGQTVVVSQRLGATRTSASVDARNSRLWLLAAYDVQTGRMSWVGDTTPDRARSALGATFGTASDAVYAAVDALIKEPWKHVRNWRIARIDLLTGRIRPEMGGNVGRVGMRPLVSRDGRYLVYATSSGSHVGLRLRDLTTSRERWLVQEVLDAPPFAMGEARDLVPGYAFTPNSDALIVSYGGKLRRIDIRTGRTSIIPFVADVERELGPLAVHQFILSDTAVRTRGVLQPALSPDGTWVAFNALDRIWTMELPHNGHAGSKPHRLTTDSRVSESYPSWSPDGQWIIYSAWVDGEGGSIRRVRVMHDKPGWPRPSERLTTDTALYFQTAVAQDGKRVVAVRASVPADRLLTDHAFRALADSASEFDPILVWLPSNGGASRAITSLGPVYSPWFRYPVDQLYFTANQERINVGLTSWRWDGTDQQRTLTVMGSEGSGELANDPFDISGVISPDGKRALVTRKYALFELSLSSMEGSNALDLESAQAQPFGMLMGGANRWGAALGPDVSWSRDGSRVLFNQGGTLLLGDIRSSGWTDFSPVDVPLMVPVDVPTGTLVLHGARLVTMRGRQVIERGDVVVQNNRILAVGAVGQVTIPEDARVIDLSGATILPGYVDIHDHMILPKGVHGQQDWRCLVRLAYGVTAARDPEPNLSNDVFTYRERERAGDLICPRLFATGMAYYGADPQVRTLGDAQARVRPHSTYFNSETFKIYYEYSTDRRARELLAMAADEQDLNATAHTNGVELELASIIDGLSGMEHPPDIRIYDDVATVVARSGTTHTQTYLAGVYGSRNYMVRRYGGPMQYKTMRQFVPPSERAATCYSCTGERTPAHGPPEENDLFPLLGGAAKIAAKDGRVAIGAHGTIPGLGFHYELWLHSLGGMPSHEILRSATIVGATAIGHGNDFGSIEAGKLADLQVLRRNPLTDIHNTTTISYVMKNGRLYNAENLTEVWPRRKALQALYLWDP